ncbi:hypothetical protein ACWEQG_01530 [Microbispora sp. NPDC004025]
MTYTPLWSERAEKMREVLAALDPEHPETEIDAAIHRLGTWVATAVQGNFPDVSPQLLGWVYLDMAGGLKQVIDQAPHVPPRRLAGLLLVVGKNLIEEKP